MSIVLDRLQPRFLDALGRHHGHVSQRDRDHAGPLRGDRRNEQVISSGYPPILSPKGLSAVSPFSGNIRVGCAEIA
jgi:hypothetical protein